MEKESAPENRFIDRIMELKPFKPNIMHTPLNSSAKQMGRPIRILPIRAARKINRIMRCYLPFRYRSA